MDGCREPNRYTGLISMDAFLKHYTIIKNLGGGAYSDVYQIQDNYNRQFSTLKLVTVDEFQHCYMTTAVKHYTPCLMSPEWHLQLQFSSTDKRATDIFQREIQTLIANNQLTEIITLDCAIFPYYQYNFNDALTLMTETERLAMVFELNIACMALDLIGLYHNDIRPDNIMLEEAGINRVYNVNGNNYLITSPYIPIIIDFGIARLEENFSNVRRMENIFDDLQLEIPYNDNVLAPFEQFIVQKFIGESTYSPINFYV